MFTEFLQTFLLDLGRFSFMLFGGPAFIFVLLVLMAAPGARNGFIKTLRPFLPAAVYCELALALAIAPMSARLHEFAFPQSLAAVFSCAAIALWMSAGKIIFRERC